MGAQVIKVEAPEIEEDGTLAIERKYFLDPQRKTRKVILTSLPYDTVEGPTFVVEFLNEQSDSAGNQANHIHSAWRHIKGDFGLK